MVALTALGSAVLGSAAVCMAGYTVGAHLMAAGGAGSIRRGARHRRAVALTFDDGPDPRFTPHILEILRSYQAYATFFVVGKRAAQFRELATLVSTRAALAPLQAFRSSTLFWHEARRLGFELGADEPGWRRRAVGWYQRLLLARDHPLGRRRLWGKGWESRTIWLSRRELLGRYREGICEFTIPAR